MTFRLPTRLPKARALVAAAIVALCASLMNPIAAPGTPPVADGPNIVYILVDDMRADELAYLPKTRALLARQGLSFDEAISPHPLCCPARAEMLTAQYAQNNGVLHNSGRFGGYQAFDSRETIAVWAQKAGYRTAFHGKYLNGYQGVKDREPGWDTWDPLVKGVYDYRDFGFYNGDKFKNDYVTTRITERALATIDSYSGERPFLMFVDHLAPHTRIDKDGFGPAQVPPPAERKYADLYADSLPESFGDPAFNEKNMSDKAPDIRYREKVDRHHMKVLHLARVRALASVDDSVEAIVNELAATGELDDTVIMFTSDNGYALGEHRGYQKNMLSREVLRIPMLVRGPGIEADSASNRVATLVDLSATIIDLGGMEPGLPIDGEALTRTLYDKPGEPRDTTLIQTGGMAGANARYPGWEYRGVQTERYLYAINLNRPENEFLYDRSLDYHEMRNVALDPDYQAVRDELLSRVKALIDCSGSNCNRTFGSVPNVGR